MLIIFFLWRNQLKMEQDKISRCDLDIERKIHAAISFMRSGHKNEFNIRNSLTAEYLAVKKFLQNNDLKDMSTREIDTRLKNWYTDEIVEVK